MEDDLIDASLLRRLKSAKARPSEQVAQLLKPSRDEEEAGPSSSQAKPAAGATDSTMVANRPKGEIEFEIEALQQMLRSCTGINDRSRKRLRECTQIAIWQQHLFAEERRHWYEADRRFRRRLESKPGGDGGGSRKRVASPKRVHAREILGKRVVEGVSQYLVSWVEPVPDSWHSVEALNCGNLIESFEAHRGESLLHGGIAQKGGNDSAQVGHRGAQQGPGSVSSHGRKRERSRQHGDLGGGDREHAQDLGGEQKRNRGSPGGNALDVEHEGEQYFGGKPLVAAKGASDESTTARPTHDQTELRAFIQVLKCLDTLTQGVNSAQAIFDTDSEEEDGANDTVSEDDDTV